MAYLRKFFWSTTISALLMIVSSQTGALSTVIGKISQMQQTQTQMIQVRKTASEPPIANVDPNDPRTTLEQEQIESSKVKLPFDNELPKDTTVSDSDMEYVVDGKKYVYIEGQYYEARTDNIYNVNGRKVFFVNNRGRSQRDQEIKRRTATAPLPTSGTVPRDAVSFPMDGSISPAEMLMRVQEAKKSMQQQRQYLNEITTQTE